MSPKMRNGVKAVPQSTKTFSFFLFDIKEDGMCFGLRSSIHLRRWKDSENLIVQSVLDSNRKRVSVNCVVDGVFL